MLRDLRVRPKSIPADLLPRPGPSVVGHVPAEQKRHRILFGGRRGGGRQEKREAVGFLRSPSFELGFCRLALRTGLIRELDPEGHGRGLHWRCSVGSALPAIPQDASRCRTHRRTQRPADPAHGRNPSLYMYRAACLRARLRNIFLSCGDTFRQQEISIARPASCSTGQHH